MPKTTAAGGHFGTSSLLISRGPVIIYHLMGWGGGGQRILGGITWFLGEQKGGSVITENPKGGSLKTSEEFRGGTTQICLENEDMGGGGSRKSSNVIRRDHFSEVTLKGGIGPRSSIPSRAINNDWSLQCEILFWYPGYLQMPVFSLLEWWLMCGHLSDWLSDHLPMQVGNYWWQVSIIQR